MFINEVIDHRKTVRYGTVRQDQMFDSFTVLRIIDLTSI